MPSPSPSPPPPLPLFYDQQQSRRDNEVITLRNHFDELDQAMVQFYRDTTQYQSSTNAQLLEIKAKVAYLETLNLVDKEKMLSPPSYQTTDSVSRPSSDPSHSTCHCIIL